MAPKPAQQPDTPPNLLGYSGQPATVNLADGFEMSAAEVVGLGFKHYQAEISEGGQDVPSAANWNEEADSIRCDYCQAAIAALNSAQAANGAAVDVATTLDVVGVQAEKLLGMQLIDAALTEVKALSRPWSQMTEDQQRDVLERITTQTKNAVRETIRLIATNGAQHIVCTLEQITVKKGAKAVLDIPKAALDQVLLDAVESEVILVVGPPLKAAADIQTPRPDPSQATLLPPDSLVVHSDPAD